MIAKTEEKLSKCRIEYKQCYSAHRQHPTQQTLAQYIDAHNAYVQQLHATNAMLETYHQETVPQLIQELEEVYNDLCCIMSESIYQGAEAISARVSEIYADLFKSWRAIQKICLFNAFCVLLQALETTKRYDNLAMQSKSISGQTDLMSFAKNMPVSANLRRVPKKMFASPQPHQDPSENPIDYNVSSAFIETSNWKWFIKFAN